MTPWRTRAVIQTPAPLSGKDFLIGKFRVRSRPELRGEDCPPDITFVDVILDGSEIETAEEAHVLGIESLYIFLDRLSVVSYSPCNVAKIISTCPVDVPVGQPFSMATSDISQNIEYPEIMPEHIAPFNKEAQNTAVPTAIHHIRLALASADVEQHLLHLYIAAEQLALQESDEYVEYKCKKCSYTWDGPLASRRAVKKLLRMRGLSSKDIEDAAAYRGKITHGGGNRDTTFYNRVTELAGAIESAVISTVANRAGITVQRHVNVIAGFPITTHQAMKVDDDGGFIITNTVWKVPLRFTKLDENISVVGGTCMAGYPTSPDGTAIIDPTSWPN